MRFRLVTAPPKGGPGDIFYVWHLPVRITHWTNVAAFAVLALTGTYIASPVIRGLPLMQVRIAHEIAGYVLLCSVGVRIYWAFKGDRGASWRTFFPYLRKDGMRKIRDELAFYLFLRRDPPPSSTVVNISHSLVLLGFVFEIATGFMLLFGWIPRVFPEQYVRLSHVLVMWLIIAFTIEHIYVAVLLDFKERSGLVSSMVTGFMSHERNS